MDLLRKTRRERDIKILSRRLRVLKHEFDVLKHYWKVRCKERKALTFSRQYINSLCKRIKLIENISATKLNRKMFIFKRGNKKEPRYFLSMTTNEILKLRLLLERTRRITYPDKNKRYFQVTYQEYNQLRYLLKTLRRKHKRYGNIHDNPELLKD